MSRKTTTKIVSAFLAGTPLTVSNSTTDGEKLYLFGNLIAEKRGESIFVTNAGWNSNTTKERLNGIPGVSISQKKGKWYLNGKEWDGQWTKITNH